jgi:predicted nucleotidyltransferase
LKHEILNKLKEIEKSQSIKILFAVESGSRAWGFASKDSDYDVRFVYSRPVEWYLSIYQRKDVIEYPPDDVLDISGWDIKKALQLFQKSNPPMLEWIKSPITYIENGNFRKRLIELGKKFFYTEKLHASLFAYGKGKFS